MATQPSDLPIATALPEYETRRTKRKTDPIEYEEPIRDLGGRPSVWKAEYIGIIARLYEHGSTDDEVSEIIGIDRSTLHRWTVDKPELCNIRKIGKEASDNRIELSLYEKAISGDTTAMIFWLKNRRYRQWRDRREIVADVSVSNQSAFDVRLLSDEQRETLRALLEAATPKMITEGEFTDVND